MVKYEIEKSFYMFLHSLNDVLLCEYDTALLYKTHFKCLRMPKKQPPSLFLFYLLNSITINLYIPYFSNIRSMHSYFADYDSLSQDEQKSDTESTETNLDSGDVLFRTHLFKRAGTELLRQQ